MDDTASQPPEPPGTVAPAPLVTFNDPDCLGARVGLSGGAVVQAVAYRVYPPGWDRGQREHGPLDDHYSLLVESLHPQAWFIRNEHAYFDPGHLDAPDPGCDTGGDTASQGGEQRPIRDGFKGRGWYGARTPGQFLIEDRDTALDMARLLVTHTTNPRGETYAQVAERLAVCRGLQQEAAAARPAAREPAA